MLYFEVLGKHVNYIYKKEFCTIFEEKQFFLKIWKKFIDVKTYSGK